MDPNPTVTVLRGEIAREPSDLDLSDQNSPNEGLPTGSNRDRRAAHQRTDAPYTKIKPAPLDS
jgi:hypothetical protein